MTSLSKRSTARGITIIEYQPTKKGGPKAAAMAFSCLERQQEQDQQNDQHEDRHRAALPCTDSASLVSMRSVYEERVVAKGPRLRRVRRLRRKRKSAGEGFRRSTFPSVEG